MSEAAINVASDELYGFRKEAVIKEWRSDMKKLLLASSLLAAIVVSGNAFAKKPHPTDTDPVTNLCSVFEEGDVWVFWDDSLDPGEKFGGDMEVDVEIDYVCDDTSEGTLFLTVEVELDKDEEAALSYSCDGEGCSAHSLYEDEFGWGPIVYEAVDTAISTDVVAACGGEELVVGSDTEITNISFGVKEMNPGPEKSQDKVKAKIDIYPEADNECAL